MRRGLQRRASSGSPDGVHVASSENLRAGCIKFQPVYRGDVGNSAKQQYCNTAAMQNRRPFGERRWNRRGEELPSRTREWSFDRINVLWIHRSVFSAIKYRCLTAMMMSSFRRLMKRVDAIIGPPLFSPVATVY